MELNRQDITGLVLAGGRGSRMGGVDKGLQLWRGEPMALHALRRLQPQVGPLALNANRNHEAYAALGAPFAAPVWPDADGSFAGPLAGWLAGLAACNTPWLVTAACDTPNFPADLVARLAAAAREQGADIAMACGMDEGQMRTQPVFCLLRQGLATALAEALAAGERKVDRFTASQRCVLVNFNQPGDDPAAFVNINTLDELRGH